MRIIKIVGDKKEEMTPEEIAALEKEVAQQPASEQTSEERIAVLEETTDDMILLMAELIGGN